MTRDSLPISQAELVSLLAMLTATVALSIDAMLPALPDISAALSPDDPNRAQLVLGTFFIGLGLGTFFAGPLSDAFGRRTIAVAGAIIYTVSALLAALAPNMETLLLARLVQGVGASGPRVIAIAIARDLFSGRRMAQIVSYVIFVFTLTPIIAPSIGWAIAWAFGWRAIFYTFAIFAVISMAWLLIRLPETLRPEHVRPFRAGRILSGLREILSNRNVLLAGFVQTLIFSTLVAGLTSTQQVFGEVFDKEDSFPLWFALMAFLAAGSNLVNARVVFRLGMREVVRRALLAHLIFTSLFLAAQLTGTLPAAWAFPVTFLWLTSNFCLAGFGLGNMNALALEPLGHIAGLATSIITAFATIIATILAVPVGLMFDGTTLPLTLGILALAVVALLALLQLPEGEREG